MANQQYGTPVYRLYRGGTLRLSMQTGKAVAAALREALPADAPVEITASMEVKCEDEIMHVFMMGKPPFLRLTVMIGDDAETFLGNSEMPAT